MTNRIEAYEAMLAMVQEAARQDIEANIDGRMHFAADTQKFYAYVEAWESLAALMTEREGAR